MAALAWPIDYALKIEAWGRELVIIGYASESEVVE
jgi:hypothetical protein